MLYDTIEIEQPLNCGLDNADIMGSGLVSDIFGYAVDIGKERIAREAIKRIPNKDIRNLASNIMNKGIDEDTLGEVKQLATKTLDRKSKQLLNKATTVLTDEAGIDEESSNAINKEIEKARKKLLRNLSGSGKPKQKKMLFDYM